MANSSGIFRFPGTSRAPLAAVGGKAMSLIESSGAKLPVPPGFVLSTSFFSAWIEKLRNADLWKVAPNPDREALGGVAKQLQALCQDLQFTSEQEAAIAAELEKFPPGTLFAVRSSAPEEDLESASFAGVYETILGTTRDTIASTVRKVFASCVDERVLIYKREHGFDPRKTEIAIIIQQQIASEISGVAFSVNPLNNCYDEALISANFGLGETVVQGTVTPDTFVADKIKVATIERTLGSKESSLWLTAGGGTEEKQNYKSGEFTLSDKQLQELVTLVNKVEKHYKKPIDIEWAFADNKLYLLQARAITTYIPLPPEMITKPGEQKRIYLDITISVQGIYKPLSPMASSCLLNAFDILIGTRQLGHKVPPGDTIAQLVWGRIYAKVSRLMRIAGKEKLSIALQNLDPIAAQIIGDISENEYKELGLKPKQVVLEFLPLIVLRLGPSLFRVVFDPVSARQRIKKRVAEYEKSLSALSPKLPAPALARKALEMFGNTIFADLVPSVILSRIAIARMKSFVPKDMQEQGEILDRALEGNVTVEMGMELSNLAKMVPSGMTLDELFRGYSEGTLEAELKERITTFISKYGHRGPVELDIASPRYRDNPRLLLEQMVNLSKSDDDPIGRFEQNKRQREEAYAAIHERLQKSDSMRAHLFEQSYKIVANLGGLRETPKFYLILTLDKIRQALLKEGSALAAAGRLRAAEQVFDLTLEQLAAGQKKEKIDLIAQAAENRRPLDRLAKVPELPRVIDSRGRVFRAKPKEIGEGAYAGMAICSGVTTGPVKVLNSPHEKPFNSGDILVARATDPGWTPLFVNAAAVILEVGGPLQHGALVAREYGLPCVAGIPDATKLWEDGTIVEVDGTQGVVRIVEPKSSLAPAAATAGGDTKGRSKKKSS